MKWLSETGETFLECTTRIILKHKMPTRAIRTLLHDLTNELQIILSHIEQLTPGKTKVQQAHIKEIRSAMKAAVKIIGKIQNLAAIELGEQ
jgi:hypothetical protein